MTLVDILNEYRNKQGSLIEIRDLINDLKPYLENNSDHNDIAQECFSDAPNASALRPD